MYSLAGKPGPLGFGSPSGIEWAAGVTHDALEPGRTGAPEAWISKRPQISCRSPSRITPTDGSGARRRIVEIRAVR